MGLTVDELYDRVDGLHLDELDLRITYDSGGFSVAENRNGLAVSDIGSSFEVPAAADEHGRVAFIAGPWRGYQYHADYVTPRHDNYDHEIAQLTAGEVGAVLVGVTAISENDTWVFGVQVVK